MGVPVNDCRAGALVWVQRKNGSWWPGRVLDPNEFSHPKQLGTPVKLLGKEDASVDWYNLEKSKRVKAFRCGEFDHCIGRAESSQASYSNKIVKNMHRGAAILYALELEKLEVKKKRKASGEERAGIICRGKRSRRVFVSDESNNCWKHATINAEPSQALYTLKMHKYPLQSDVAEENTSSRSMAPDSSECGSIRRLQTRSQRSDAARVGVNGSRYFGKHYVQSVNLYRKGRGELNNFSTSPSKTASNLQNCRVQEKEGICNLTKRKRVLTDGKNHEKLKNLEKSGSHCSDETNMEKFAVFPYRRETMLVDVEVTVKIQCGREHVPLVSLMSKTSGRAFVGHPIDVEEMDAGSSDALLAEKSGIGRSPSGNGTRAMLPTTWKTCRRTPVCYAPAQSPGQLNVKERSIQTKPLKKRPLPVLGGEGGLQTAVKGKNGGVPSGVTCVPVKLVFEKLLMAFGKA